jgi:heptaprenyl diphosphate synthase
MDTTVIAKDRVSMHGFDFQGQFEVDERLKSVLSDSEGITREECMSLLSSGGKRLRPYMVINSGLCFSKLNSGLINTAVAAELIHMASLVHDDIIDNSSSRRGISTINSVYGNHSAVLSGDFLFARAFSVLSSCRLIREMEYLVEAISQMCDGEIKQAADAFNTSITVEEYFKRIGKKTGILISSCCCAGAAAAGASNDQIMAMREYGLNVGYAFQIMDDLLDFVGREAKLGKPVGKDLIQGNITLPVILFMEDKQYGYIKRIISKGIINTEEYKHIVEGLKKSGAMERTCMQARNCITAAKAALKDIKNSEYKLKLVEIADMVINREY